MMCSRPVKPDNRFKGPWLVGVTRALETGVRARSWVASLVRSCWRGTDFAFAALDRAPLTGPSLGRMNASALLDTLRKLEVEMHQPHVPASHVADDGTLERHTLRTSLWQSTGHRWRLRFHQGAPVAAFEKHAT